MADLFPDAHMLSPRLAWLRQHGLALRRMEGGRWRCELDEDNFGTGASEDDATIDLCLKTGLPHFKTPI